MEILKFILYNNLPIFILLYFNIKLLYELLLEYDFKDKTK
jgi:hypothetical protein